MGIISEVKCGRCDRRYSGLRSRCPYCGARRNKPGKHADGSDNAKGKLIIGILLLIILIVAVIVLIVTSVGANEPTTGEDEGRDPTDIVGTGDDDVTTIDGTKPEIVNPDDPAGSGTEPDDTNDPDVAPQVKVEAIRIKYAGTVLADLDFSMRVGEQLQLTYETVPQETGLDPEWSSSNEEVFIVSQDGQVTAVSSGTETLTLTVGEKTLECIVRVN